MGGFDYSEDTSESKSYIDTNQLPYLQELWRNASQQVNMGAFDPNISGITNIQDRLLAPDPNLDRFSNPF